ncbi:MAG: hypothetical protein LBI03_02090 [Clostridiales bacterium]|jgi:hypothetical protein|nr:hypothetical protein [Clostridiales bacterium]
MATRKERKNAMFRLVKNELVKLKIPVILTVVLLSITAIVLTGTLYKSYSLDYDLEAWEIGREIIDFLFPLFVVVPICWLMYYERKNNFLLYTVPRVGKAKYLTAKWMAAAVSAFAIIFTPYFLSAVFALYVKPPIVPHIRLSDVSPFTHIYLDTFINAPLMYAFLLSLWKSVIGVMVMSLGFVLSLYVKNIFVILTGPFIYSTLENFSLAILGMPEYRLITSFEPSVVSEKGISLVSPVIGPMLLIIFTAVLWLFFTKFKRTTVYEV